MKDNAPTGMKILRAALLALPVAASIACGSNLSGPDGGPGASTGTAGATGAGGRAGAGGTGGGAGSMPLAPAPGCVLELIAGCPLAGACQRADADGGVQQTCYASGVRAVSTTVRECVSTQSGDRMSVLEVYNADGTLCYRQESHCECPQGCEIVHLTWRNAAGDSVATGYSGTVTTVMCAESGETCTGPWNSSTGKFPCLPPAPDQACTAGSSCPSP